MFLTRSEYDRGVNTFSPEGRLFQVEYAIEAIKLGSTAIGIQTAEGVVLAVEKRITSPLMEPSSMEKIMKVDSHLGCATSGLIGDSRTLVEKSSRGSSKPLVYLWRKNVGRRGHASRFEHGVGIWRR